MSHKEVSAAAENLQAASNELAAARANAMATALHLRDIDFLIEKGLIEAIDEDARAAAENDRMARRALSAARSAVRDAQQSLEAATRNSEADAQREDHDRRESIVRKDHPEVASAFDAAEEEWSRLVQLSSEEYQRTPHAAHVPNRQLHAAGERRTRARADFEAAMQAVKTSEE